MIPVLLTFCLLFASETTDDIDTAVKSFVDVFSTVEREAADPVIPDKAFYEGAIPGMLRRLDPHTVFFDPGQFEQLKRMQESREKGFGTVVSLLPGRVVVLQTLPGTPSARSGIEPGDEILGINGYRIDRLDVEQLIALLSESRKDKAYLAVRRPGNVRILQFTLTPEEMQAPSVDRTYFLRAGVGYIRVTNFEQDTGKDVQEAIKKLGGRNLKALVLDLRNNPGGALPSALQVAALFLKPGKVLLSVRGRKVKETTESVPEGFVPYEVPLAVLINGKSASASEIVAGALQDHDRAVIIGEPSYGKGLVQAVYPLSADTGIALTTSFYYTPSGRSIQRQRPGIQLHPGAYGQTDGSPRDFKTDSGRVVVGGGGIEPDVVVYPESMNKLRTVLDASGSFTSFATFFLQQNKSVSEDFEVTPALLDEFQLYLSERDIRPSIADWSSERAWITNRLKTEILNQGIGVAKGEEVEAQRDPAILQALKSLHVE